MALFWQENGEFSFHSKHRYEWVLQQLPMHLSSSSSPSSAPHRMLRTSSGWCGSLHSAIISFLRSPVTWSLPRYLPCSLQRCVGVCCRAEAMPLRRHFGLSARLLLIVCGLYIMYVLHMICLANEYSQSDLIGFVLMYMAGIRSDTSRGWIIIQSLIFCCWTVIVFRNQFSLWQSHFFCTFPLSKEPNIVEHGWSAKAINKCKTFKRVHTYENCWKVLQI